MCLVLRRRISILKHTFSKRFCSKQASLLIEVYNQERWPQKMLFQFLNDCNVISNFITTDEEQQLIAEIEPHMKRMRWEEEHWDQQIHLYREREHRKWNVDNQKIIERVWANSFPDVAKRSPFVHILDLHENGYIRPHLDEARYCGRIISGLSLLSPSIMRLQHNKPELKEICLADLLLPRRSLYRLNGIARFEFTHAILANPESQFRGEPVYKHRRISVICREVPDQRPKNLDSTPENIMKPIE